MIRPSHMFFQVLVSLTGLEVISANHAKYAVFHNFGISEKIRSFIVEIGIVV